MAGDGFKINLRGMEDAEKQLRRIERNTRKMGDYKAIVFSRLPYAYGQEYGRHRVSGKLARRTGGAMYLNRARSEMLSGADRDLSEGLNKVTSPGVWVLRRLALWTRRLAKQYAPRSRGVKRRGSYRLHRSINVKVYRR